MKVIYPPSRLRKEVTHQSVFLAGAIDMGAAVDWQKEVVENFSVHSLVTFFNPRRVDWDSNWEQSIANDKFVEQVNWELDKIEEADIVFFFFPKNSMAPISLFEFGVCIERKPHSMIVVAEPGYWRRGNLEVVCNRAGIRLHETLRGGLIDLGHIVL